MQHLDDADSSSAGLSDLNNDSTHALEIDAPNPSTDNKVRQAVEALAFGRSAYRCGYFDSDLLFCLVQLKFYRVLTWLARFDYSEASPAPR